MKRILLAVTMLVLVLPALRQAEAGVDVSIDFFYDNIGSDGSWVEVADYGYCWQPTIAVSNTKWRPYSDGYWAYTDVGWTWVSYEDFGWATYHYGRWTRLRDRGWFWVPGREWGPAWVSWRTGGDYVGWAPLPPRGRDVDYDNRPISGHVDVEFDIGPSYYNFVEVRYIGEPVLRERIVEPHLNITYISNTVNVTNISYTNSLVYNYGPDYDTMSRYSTRPIRRMTIERDANVDLSVAVKSNGLTRVQGDKLIVGAPLTFQKPSKPLAPKMVKEKIAKPTFERGWSDADPKAQAELKEKMKSEDPKKVAPPSTKPNDNAQAAQSPGSVSPAASAPGTMPAAPGITPPGKPKKERGDKPSMSPPGSTVPGTTPAPAPAKPSDRKQTTPSSLVTSPDGTPYREPAKPDQESKKNRRSEKAPDAMPPTRQPSEPMTEKAPRKPKNEAPDVMPPTRQPPETATEKMPRKPKTEPTMAPPTREIQSDAQSKRPMPPPQMAPPKREAPPEAPHKQPPPDIAPKERTAPPPGPANEPVKREAPKGPDKKAKEPAPSPGP
jgi:hypothetical protein